MRNTDGSRLKHRDDFHPAETSLIACSFNPKERQQADRFVRMKSNVLWLITAFSLISSLLSAQGVPVFGGFPQQVDWYKYEGYWAPDKTVYYEYGFVGDVFVVQSEETRINSVPVSRTVYTYNEKAYPTIYLNQTYSNGTWKDVYRIVYEWNSQNPENLLMSRYLYQVFQNNEWLIQFGTQYQFEFFNNGQRRRETLSNYNMLTGSWDLSTRTRTSFDAWGRNIGDTTEVYLNGDWAFSGSEMYYFKPTDTVNDPDSTISFTWVPADDVWALSWWKPVLRYIYHREPYHISWTVDQWDDIALEWFRTSRGAYQYDESWNLTLNLQESFKDEWWETGEWKITHGQRYTYTWDDSLPVERITETWIPPTETAGGQWNNSTREIFSHFLDVPISNKEFDETKRDVTVFPVPFSQYIKVCIPKTEESISVEIMDLFGRTRAKTNIISNGTPVGIETSHLPHGSYLLRIRQKNRSAETIRIIKN